MKIRKPWLIKSICFLGYWLVRALLTTVPWTYWRTSRDYAPANVGRKEKYIYVLWHEYMIVPMVRFCHSRVRLLTSLHADGMVVAEMCKHMRMGTVRGSSTRGGIQALRQVLHAGRYRFLAVTPDGPRGPRRKVSVGLIYMASKLGWPLIIIGVGLRRPWRMRSWDRLAIPRPFQPAAFTTAEPLTIPPDLDRDQMEAWRQKVEEILNVQTALAEQAAQTGKRPRTVTVEVPTETMSSVAA
jgi:lysophospholipid acyltransferase (LPLAT)-like uncharacterized protein